MKLVTRKRWVWMSLSRLCLIDEVLTRLSDLLWGGIRDKLLGPVYFRVQGGLEGAAPRVAV